jgi:cephalosporin-C deacetylase-like acetyl esterase
MAGSPDKISFSAFDGTTLRGYYYRVKQQNAPVVILTAGLSFLKEHFIDTFAIKFQEAGIAAIVYDHRNWGSSDGLPRHHANLFQEVEDYSDAIAYAASLAPDIDPKRIAIWGAGHAGGVVMPVAAYDQRVKAVVTMVPFVS